jgi:hypothetical protein
MVFSRNPDEQRILSAIRESLLQDHPRMARLEGRPYDDSALEHNNKSVEEVSYHAAADIVPEPSINPIQRQATAQGGAITRDGPSIATNALQPSSLLGSSDSPSIAPDAHADDPNSRQTSSRKVSSVRPSVAKRLFRTAAYGAVITVIVSIAFIWQSSDDTTKDIVKGWVNSLEWSSPRFANNLPPQSESVVEAVSTSAGQPPQPKTTVILPAVSAETAPTSTATDSPPEYSSDLKKQLEAITSDLAVVRQTIAQAEARQDQMARDIATLQADQQSIRQKISGAVSHSGRRRSRP